jgi:putative SOS response-associated peptidase YedK
MIALPQQLHLVANITAATLMKPYAGAIEAWEVGAEVGNVRNNRPELMERVGLL